MWEPDSGVFRSILKAAGHPRLKVCFDVGHAHVFSNRPAQAWLEELAGEIVYLHLNDNCGDRDSELALGQGNIDWQAIFRAVREMPVQPLVTLEVNSLEAVSKSIELLLHKGMLQQRSSPPA